MNEYRLTPGENPFNDPPHILRITLISATAGQRFDANSRLVKRASDHPEYPFTVLFGSTKLDAVVPTFKGKGFTKYPLTLPDGKEFLDEVISLLGSHTSIGIVLPPQAARDVLRTILPDSRMGKKVSQFGMNPGEYVQFQIQGRQAKRSPILLEIGRYDDLASTTDSEPTESPAPSQEARAA